MNEHLCAMRLSLALFYACGALFINYGAARAADAPAPLLEKEKPVEWWFVFKFASKNFPACASQEETTSTPTSEFALLRYPGFTEQSALCLREQRKRVVAEEQLRQHRQPGSTTFEQIYSSKFRYLV